MLGPIPVLLAVAILGAACTATLERQPAETLPTSGDDPEASSPPDPSAALLTEEDLPQGFERIAEPPSTEFSLCGDRLSIPRGFELVGKRAFSERTFGRVEQTVATAGARQAASYLRSIRAAAADCTTFTEGDATYVVEVARPGELADSVSIAIRRRGELPLGVSVVFAVVDSTVIRIVEVGSGSPVELSLARSLAFRVVDRLKRS
jgi:hypothetical protein